MPRNEAFTLPWSVISSGGMGGSAGGYTIHSTLGQPVAGAVDGGSYHLTSGFWTEVIESIEEFFNFLPLIVQRKRFLNAANLREGFATEDRTLH